MPTLVHLPGLNTLSTLNILSTLAGLLALPTLPTATAPTTAATTTTATLTIRQRLTIRPKPRRTHLAARPATIRPLAPLSTFAIYSIIPPTTLIAHITRSTIRSGPCVRTPGGAARADRRAGSAFRSAIAASPALTAAAATATTATTTAATLSALTSSARFTFAAL